MQEWYLEWEKVSCLERCLHFRSVLIERFHCKYFLVGTFVSNSQAKGKLKLGYGKASGVGGLAMSRAQDDTICSVLEES